MNDIFLGLILAVLLGLSAFFSGSETILFSLTAAQRRRIKEKNPRGERLVESCLADSALLLSTLLVGNTIVNFAIATIGYHLFVKYFSNVGGFAAVPTMTILLLIFGEILPKQIALRKTETLAPYSAMLLVFWRGVLAPFNMVLKSASRAFSKSLERERRALSDAELLSVLSAAAERGEFSSQDAKMVEGVLRLSELHANDEMTPRVDMETYDLDLDESLRAKNLEASNHRYIPAIRRSPDNVEGVYDSENKCIEDALFVPETITLDDLLVIFIRSKKPLAMVVDEYGGTAGLITPSDVLEIIFGPKVFARPGDEPQIKKLNGNVWEIDARANLDEINRELDIELDAGDADRLSGWVQYHAERVPHIGQEIEADGCKATILKRRRRRVELVRLEVLDFPEAVSDEEIIAETDEAVERTEEDL